MEILCLKDEERKVDLQAAKEMKEIGDSLFER